MNIKKLFSPRVRNRTFAVLTVLLIAVLFLLNFLLTTLPQNGAFIVDLTPEGLHTVSDRMVEECAFLADEEKLSGEKIKVTFCADPDLLISSAVLRPTYFMACALEREYDMLEVETVNIEHNPTAVAKYKTTSLSKISQTDVIISHGNVYRIINADAFWITANNAYWSYNGEYRFASLLLSLLGTQSKAYFVTGHGETVFHPDAPESEESLRLSAFYNLLRECGMGVGLLDLSSVDEIPEDCALLIINNPQSDYVDGVELDSFYAVSEIEKIDRFLVERQGALAVAKDYRVSLPTLEYYLKEWGIGFGSAQVRDEKEYLEEKAGDFSTLIGQYDTDTESYGYAIYGDFVSTTTSPEVVIKDTGYVECTFEESLSRGEDGGFRTSRNYAPFLSTSTEARAFLRNALGDYLVKDYGKLDTSAVSVRMTTDSYSGEESYSYVFAAAAATFFENDMLANASYANYDVIGALVRNISRVDEHASTALGGVSLNSERYGGKQLLDTSIVTTYTEVYGYDKEVIEVNHPMTAGMLIFIYIFVAILPIAALVVGAVVAIRRRYL